MMKNIPIWQDIKTKKYPKLEEDAETDILIIGGGITGLSTFYELKNNPCKIILVDKYLLGYGATSRSTAKITYLQENIYTKLKNSFDFNTAKLYYESQKEAIKQIVDICHKNDFDCDLEPNSSHLYTTKKSEINKIEEEYNILEMFGEKPQKGITLPNNKKVKSQIYVNNTYVFHPLKYIHELARISHNKEHLIYENTNIEEIVKKNNLFYCKAGDYTIKARQVVVASHYPNFLFPYLFPLKCYIEKSTLIATKEKNINKFNAINISNPILSIRNYQDYYIHVGSTHNLCFDTYPSSDYPDLLKQIPSKNISYNWSNHDIMTYDNLPFIGEIKPNLFLATGFNTWGMTGGVLSSLILKDLLEKRPNKYEYIFNPLRNNKEKLLKYPVNIFSNTYSFIASKINLHKKAYKKNPYYTELNGQKVAIYKDENNKEHIVYSTCPHLGCSLIFNKEEKTWDCPCHGSRFTIEGKSIIGPSDYDISYDKKN